MDLSGDELLKLDNEVGFALYACSKGLIRKYNPVLEGLGLTYTSYLVMLALWERDGISVSELGKKLYLDSGTLTPLLKKMEKQGLLQRRRDETDERVVLILLTPKGRALQAKTERNRLRPGQDAAPAARELAVHRPQTPARRAVRTVTPRPVAGGGQT